MGTEINIINTKSIKTDAQARKQTDGMTGMDSRHKTNEQRLDGRPDVTQTLRLTRRQAGCHADTQTN